MKTAAVWLGVWVLMAVAVSPVSAQSSASGTPVRIALLLDSDSETLTGIAEDIQREIADLLAGEFSPVFQSRITLTGEGTVEDAKADLTRLLESPEVDMAITVGYIGSTAALHMGPHPKPVIAPFALDARLQGLTPASGGGSGIRNLSYLSSPEVVSQHIDVLRRIVPVRRLALIAPAAMFATNPRWSSEVSGLEALYDLEISTVPFLDTIEATLRSIPAEVEAVSVLTPNLSYDEVQSLAEGLILRGLPSFSFVGGKDVELGLLAGMQTDEKVNRFSRRVALNIQRILLGAEPAELPVSISLVTRLTINMATVRALGISPPWEIRLEAEMLNQEPPPDAVDLTLRGVMQDALQVSPDLMAQREAVAAGRQQVNLARSPLWPQAEIGASGVLIDKDRAEASFGSAAERTYSASATVTQLLFSEDARAGHGIQKHLQVSREMDLDQLRLDVVLEAAEAYLNVLRALTLEQIQRENLQLTQSNLDNARVRETIGVAGPAETFRWEVEISQRRNDLITANSRRNLAEIELNRVLNRPLEAPFIAEDVRFDQGVLSIDENWMRRNLADPASFRRLRAWIVEEAERKSPELRALDAVIAAQERALAAADRAYYLPTLALQGSYERVLERSGAGAEGLGFDPATVPPAQQELAMLLGSVFPESPDDDNWSVGLSLTLPLFEGGGHRAEQVKARRDLESLHHQREATALRIAQRARSAAHAAGASFANIRHSRDAADAAARTLAVVRDAYARGSADLLDLLDAQNAALVTDQVAANAIYDFLVDYMNTERAMGRFELLMDEEGRADELRRLEAFIEAGDGAR